MSAICCLRHGSRDRGHGVPGVYACRLRSSPSGLVGRDRQTRVDTLPRPVTTVDHSPPATATTVDTSPTATATNRDPGRAPGTNAAPRPRPPRHRAHPRPRPRPPRPAAATAAASAAASAAATATATATGRTTRNRQITPRICT